MLNFYGVMEFENFDIFERILSVFFFFFLSFEPFENFSILNLSERYIGNNFS